MEIQLEGVELSEMPPSGELFESLSDDSVLLGLLGQVRRRLLDCGLMAGSMVLDGQFLTEELESELGELPLSRFERLQIEVQKLNQFLAGMFEECLESLPKLLDLKEQISQDIREGRLVAASRGLAAFSRDLAVFLSAYRSGLTLICNSGLERTSTVDAGNRRLEGLKQVLAEIQDGLGRRDFVLISDALEFELPEHLDRLHGDFRAWSERLGAS